MVSKRNSKGNSLQTPANKGRMQKKLKPQKRKANRFLYYILISVILIGTIVTLSLTVFFKIENITVVGNTYYANEDITKATDFKIGENLFLTSTKGVAENLTTKFPYLETVTVRRVLPPAIEIDVTLSDVAASLDIGNDEFAIISSSGKVLERGLVLLPADVILVKGFEIGDKQPGDYLGVYTPVLIKDDDTKDIIEIKKAENQKLEEIANAEKESLMVVKYFNDAIKENNFTNLSNLDISDPYNMTVLYEDRLLLKLGTELRLDYKLRLIKVIIDQKLDPDAKGTIFAEDASTETAARFVPAEDYVAPKDPSLVKDPSEGEISEQSQTEESKAEESQTEESKAEESKREENSTLESDASVSDEAETDHDKTKE